MQAPHVHATHCTPAPGGACVDLKRTQLHLRTRLQPQSDSYVPQVCDMHARLKKLESDRDMEWGHVKGTLGRTASFGHGTQQQPPLHATHSSPAINGGHENLDIAKTQVGLVSRILPVTGVRTRPALHARLMGLGRLS